MFGVTAIVLALAGAPDAGHRFAASLASAGPRPAAGELERKAQARVAARFREAGLRVGHVHFAVPGKGRSRDVVGEYDTPARCLEVVMAHTDSMPRTPGADDNASGVGVLVALAPRLAAIKPRCDVWLVATGAEERLYTGSPDHLGARALVREVKRRKLEKRLRFALALDEVGSRRSFVLRSPVAAVRPSVEGALLAAARSAKVPVAWRRDEGTGNSDHREFQLAGLPGMKLGVADNPCRHEPCDRPGRLDDGAFRRARAVVERLLSRR